MSPSRTTRSVRRGCIAGLAPSGAARSGHVVADARGRGARRQSSHCHLPRRSPSVGAHWRRHPAQRASRGFNGFGLRVRREVVAVRNTAGHSDGAEQAREPRVGSARLALRRSREGPLAGHPVDEGRQDAAQRRQLARGAGQCRGRCRRHVSRVRRTADRRGDRVRQHVVHSSGRNAESPSGTRAWPACARHRQRHSPARHTSQGNNRLTR